MSTETISVNPADLSADIGLPVGSTMPWQTALALAKTVKVCTAKKIELGVACIAGSSVVTWARSKVVDTFLKGNAKHLVWVDSDMVWEPEDFIRLLVLANTYGVVCAAYAQKTDEQVIVIRRDDLHTFEINPHGLIRFHGCGLGFTAIKREIVERLVASKPQVYDPAGQCSIADVFRLDTVDRGHEHPDVRHEDVAFFADLIEMGVDVWLDPTIQLGHVGPKVYSANTLAALGLDDAFKANGSNLLANERLVEHAHAS